MWSAASVWCLCTSSAFLCALRALRWLLVFFCFLFAPRRYQVSCSSLLCIRVCLNINHPLPLASVWFFFSSLLFMPSLRINIVPQRKWDTSIIPAKTKTKDILKKKKSHQMNNKPIESNKGKENVPQRASITSLRTIYSSTTLMLHIRHPLWFDAKNFWKYLFIRFQLR